MKFNDRFIHIWKIILLIFSVLSFNFTVYSTDSAQNILKKVKSEIVNAKGISANVTLNGNGIMQAGTFKAKGDKFTFASKGNGIWYDGKNMWVYNSASGETSLYIPEREEIAQSNPLMYIRNYESDYTPYISKKIAKGMTVILLVPHKGKQQPKVELYLDKADRKPLKFIIYDNGNGQTTVEIKNLTYSAPVSDKDFIYPKSKYPGIEVVDLR